LGYHFTFSNAQNLIQVGTLKTFLRLNYLLARAVRTNSWRADSDDKARKITLNYARI